jgi:hypothetical protein
MLDLNPQPLKEIHSLAESFPPTYSRESLKKSIHVLLRIVCNCYNCFPANDAFSKRTISPIKGSFFTYYLKVYQNLIWADKLLMSYTVISVFMHILLC